MIRNLKILGVAVVAILAMTAVMASAAHATKLTAGASSGYLIFNQTTEQVLTTTAGTLRCTTSNQEGTYSSASVESVEVSAAYSGCKAFGFLSATVNMGNCKYLFTGAGQAGGKALADVVCTSGEITVSTTGCVVHIPAQTGLGTATLSNGGGAPDDVHISLNISNTKYTETAGCPNVSSNSTTTNGTLTGGATIRAFDTGFFQVNLTAH